MYGIIKLLASKLSEFVTKNLPHIHFTEAMITFHGNKFIFKEKIIIISKCIYTYICAMTTTINTN